MDKLTLKITFEEARQLYSTRGKRGLEPEWATFLKRSKSREWKLAGWTVENVVPLLKPAIEAQTAYRDGCAGRGEWCPPWKNFQTWINGGWWTEEVPQDGKPKRKKCKCGQRSTHSLIVYFEGGARTDYICNDCPDPEPDWRKRRENSNGNI